MPKENNGRMVDNLTEYMGIFTCTQKTFSTSTPLLPTKREVLAAGSTSAAPPLRLLQPQQQQHWQQQPTFYATAAPQYFMAPMYSAPLAPVTQSSNPQIHINATHGNVQVKVSQPPPQQPHYLPPPHGLCAASCCQLMPYGGYVSYGLGQEHVMYAPANDFTVSRITVRKRLQ